MLRINREGSFEVTIDQRSQDQCGRVGVLRYKYFVTIEATNRTLTEQGFVMDNALCDLYFQERYGKKMEECPSCEQMVQDAITHFKGIFEKDTPEVELMRIMVRIHGSEVSYIEGEWKRHPIYETNGVMISGKEMKPGEVVKL